MNRSTEELLILLLWIADHAMHPTLRNLTEPFNCWADRHGLLRRIEELEARRLITRPEPGTDPRLCRLTDTGLDTVLGQVGASARWNRPWDGRWRVVAFDMPARDNTRRRTLHRILRSHGMGCLQGSVWISPDPIEQLCTILRGHPGRLDALIALEATPIAGESERAIVDAAWDWPAIHDAYSEHLAVLERMPAYAPRTRAESVQLRGWIRSELNAYDRASRMDPFLPRELIPEGYLGQVSWNRRLGALGIRAPA